MKKIRTDFTSESEKKAFVLESEAAFETILSSSVASIAAKPGLRLVTVSGPTCSGKTTASSKLETELEKKLKQVHVVSIDDFYLDRDVLLTRATEQGTKPDFDSPDSIDTETLKETTEMIFSGGDVTVPVFDFITGKRSGFRTIAAPADDDVFLFEGIQAVYPSVTSLFREHPLSSVFISVGEDAGYGDVFFGRNEIRFLRRLVRDNRFRGATTDFTFHIWETVRSNEKVNILPFASTCEFVLRSYLPYELNMLKPFAVRLLSDISPDSDYRRTADELIRKLSGLEEISPEYLPQKSLFREFLG